MITNKINGHKYIGKTFDVERRWQEHAAFSRNKTTIDRAINKYGKDNFCLDILEKCSIDDLDEMERFYIKKYNTYKDRNHYNCAPGGEGYGAGAEHLYYHKESPFKGCNHTEGTKQKMRKNHYNCSGENNPMYGRKRSKETIQKIKNNQPDTSGKNNTFYGSKHTKDAKKKISKNHADVSEMSNPGAKINIELARKILKKHEGEMTYTEIAEKYNVSKSSVGYVCRGEHWTNEKLT
jgi:group I intron endonuclease